MGISVKHICCIGAGYVGGPTMAVIADRCPHIQVNVVDLNKTRISEWNNPDFSRLPIYEPGLEEIIKRCRGKNLHFSTEIEKNISSADMIFISVNTPIKQSGLGAGQTSDLKWIEASARQISKHSRGHTIVIEKSTLPVKTAKVIKSILESSNSLINENSSPKKSFSVLSNPEFLAEGTAIKDLENPDRVLIGGDDPSSIEALAEIYSHWIEPKKILRTNLWSSELSKLTANAFLAQRISSINSVSAICESTGANIREVSNAIGMDSRIGSKFLEAGPGFGGSCFKKDILNLVYICNFYGLHEVANFWQKVLDINIWQQNRISKLVVEKLFGTLSEKKIAILGFTFKANTNDTRESPAIKICGDLLDEGCKLSIYDPKVSANKVDEDLKQYAQDAKRAWSISKSIIESAKDADAIIILTDWEEFKNISWKHIASLMRQPSWLFDTRGITNPNQIKSFGINFWSVGCGD